jgi:hypothetical protein
LRCAGIKLQEAANRENLTFETFKRWQKSLPKDLTYTAAQFCVKIGKEFQKPFESLNDIMHARRLLFEKIGAAEPPRRLAEQTAHEANPWSELVSKFTGATVFFSELEKDEPMDKWSADKLQNFVTLTKPIVAKHVEAQAKLNAAAT